MRKLTITGDYIPSKTVLLELEYKMERAALKQLTVEEEKALLHRIRGGDATAIPLLIEGYRLTILKVIQQCLKYKLSIPKAVEAAREALAQLAQQEMTNKQPYFTQFSYWVIRQAVLEQIQNRQHYLAVHYRQTDEEKNGVFTSEILSQQIPFLNQLNGILKEVEKEIIRRATELLILGEQRLTATPHFLSDYEVEASVDYYCEGKEDPVHSFFTSFTYKNVITENHYGLLTAGINWQESYMPPLDYPYCYLLHDLIDHPKEKLYASIHKINRIWMDVTYADQCFFNIDATGNGNL